MPTQIIKQSILGQQAIQDLLGTRSLLKRLFYTHENKTIGENTEHDTRFTGLLCSDYYTGGRHKRGAKN